MNTAITLKQPSVFKLAIGCSMWERFGYYVLSFLLVLYAKSEFGLSDTLAFTLYGVFTALSYLTPAIGGYLADNVFGIRRCAIVGMFLEGTGLTLLSIPSKIIFPIALAFIIVGVGFFKTAPTHLMGRSYAEKDPRIDSGFTLYYMGMNIGSLVSSILTAIIHKYFGWHVAFLVGGIGIYFGLLFYFILRKSAAEVDSDVGRTSLTTGKWLTMLIGIIATIVVATLLVAHTKIANIVLILATSVVFLYFIIEIIKSPKEEKLKIIAALTLIIMGLVFFVLYQQAFTSIVLFIKRSVNRSFLGIDIPPEGFFALNPFWVIVLGPILAWFYGQLHKKRGKDLPITLKFPLGLLLTSICFFVLVVSTWFANSEHLVSSWWVLLVYFFLTFGEMLVSALGVAMITHIAPKRMYGIMMGTWYLVGMSFSAALSGIFASIACVPENVTSSAEILNIYSCAFVKIGTIGLVCTIISFIIGPFIKRIAKLD